MGTWVLINEIWYYINSACTASIPAWAHCTSSSDVPPLKPIPPCCTLFAIIMGRHPANARYARKIGYAGHHAGACPTLPKDDLAELAMSRRETWQRS